MQWARKQARKGDVLAGDEGGGHGAEGDIRSALTFSLVPLAPVESARSLPARSTKLILLTCRQRGGSALWAQQTLPKPKSQNLLQHDTALRAAVGSAGSPLQELLRSRANILAGRAEGHQLPNILSRGWSLKGP